MSSDEDTDRRLDTPGPVEGAPPKPRSLAGLLAAEYGLESPESPPAKPSRRRRIIGGAVVGAVGAIVLGAAGFSALAPTAGLATTDPSLGRLRPRFDSLVGELQARITSLTERLAVLSRPSTTTREERIASTAPLAARPARLESPC